MICNIIACGSSASKWDGQGDSIGVNDAFKWGHKLQRLVLLNNPNEFERERLEIIKKTQVETVYTCYREWQRPGLGLTNVIYFNYNVWQGRLKPIRMGFQTSKTSPFAAISIAYNLGYDEIILWGVDFKDHPIWNQHNHNYAYEIKNYQQIAQQLKDRGVMVYSSEPSVLKLPIYEKQLV
jgi:hypothetical protein